MDALASLHAKMLRLASKNPVPAPHRAAVLGIKQHLPQPAPPSPTFPANGAARRAGEGRRCYHPAGMLGQKGPGSPGPWARKPLPQTRQDGATGPAGSGTRMHEDHTWRPEGQDGWTLQKSALGGCPVASPSLAPVFPPVIRRQACAPEDLTCCLKTNKRLPCRSAFGLEC